MKHNKLSILGMLLIPIVWIVIYLVAETMNVSGYKWEAHGNILVLLLITYLASMFASLLSVPVLWFAIKKWKKESSARTFGYTLSIVVSLICNSAVIGLVFIRMIYAG